MSLDYEQGLLSSFAQLRFGGLSRVALWSRLSDSPPPRLERGEEKGELCISGRFWYFGLFRGLYRSGSVVPRKGPRGNVSSVFCFAAGPGAQECEDQHVFRPRFYQKLGNNGANVKTIGKIEEGPPSAARGKRAEN